MKRRILLAAVMVLVAAGAHADTFDSHTEKTFQAIPGGTVSIDVSFHDVMVIVAPADTVVISADIEVRASAAKARRLLEELEPKFSERDSTIAMRSRRKGGFSFSLFGGTKSRGQVHVSMPPGMNLILETASGDCEVTGDLGPVRLRVNTASGGFKLRGAAGDLSIDTASGDVEISLARVVASIDVDTASGDVEIKGGAEKVRVDTASGDVDATGLTGAVNMDTASGGVRARWALIPVGATIRANTASGDVRFVLPPDTMVGGRVSTSSGDIVSDFPGRSENRDRRFIFQGGANSVNVDVGTASGGVKILGG